MALSEIEKLERRYAENPQGLTFAPLAEVHRKNGEVQRALDLLGPGLAIHPDYVPASIVLGRCHLDLGDVHAAEKAFLHVLSLDGENVIALKALADISERLLKFEDAERWLRTLISVDRSNDNAREQLHRVEIGRQQSGVASSAEPASVGDGDAPEPARSFETPVAEPAMGWVSQSAQVSVGSPPAEDLEPSVMRDSFDDPAGIQLEEPARFEENVRPLDGLDGPEVDLPGRAADEFSVETSEDIVLRSSGGREFQMPDASQELFASGPRDTRAPSEEAALAPTPPSETSAAGADLGPVGEPAIVGWGEGVEVPAPELEPAPMGVEQEATIPALEPLVVEPVTPEPEPALMAGPPARGAAPQPATVPVGHFPVPSAPPPAPAPRRSYAASETGGRPVAIFLKEILTSRPPAQPSQPTARQTPGPGGSGAPTRPAADALSLSSVFGEEEAPGTPPAVPAAGSGTGVTFDDFFGGSDAAPTQRNTRAPDSKNDDLDQFHAWLQNLKR